MPGVGYVSRGVLWAENAPDGDALSGSLPASALRRPAIMPSMMPCPGAGPRGVRPYPSGWCSSRSCSSAAHQLLQQCQFRVSGMSEDTPPQPGACPRFLQGSITQHLIDNFLRLLPKRPGTLRPCPWHRGRGLYHCHIRRDTKGIHIVRHCPLPFIHGPS